MKKKAQASNDRLCFNINFTEFQLKFNCFSFETQVSKVVQAIPAHGRDKEADFGSQSWLQISDS